MEEIISDINTYYRKKHLRPVFQLGSHSKIIIISQAPGKKVNESGIPWSDASGIKLREWMGVTESEFYSSENFSIMPMDFCYPGKGKNGDLPPRRDCAPYWHPKILNQIKTSPLKLLIGQYAVNYYLKGKKKESLTETVRHYKEYLPEFFPLIHPSPRNYYWQKMNPWFYEETIPCLQKLISNLINKNEK